MENTANKLSNRGIRKSTTLMVLGDHEAYIHPLYLHVRNKKVYGMLMRVGGPPAAFAVDLSEFKDSAVRLVKS